MCCTAAGIFTCLISLINSVRAVSQLMAYNLASLIDFYYLAIGCWCFYLGIVPGAQLLKQSAWPRKLIVDEAAPAARDRANAGSWFFYPHIGSIGLTLVFELSPKLLNPHLRGSPLRGRYLRSSSNENKERTTRAVRFLQGWSWTRIQIPAGVVVLFV